MLKFINKRTRSGFFYFAFSGIIKEKRGGRYGIRTIEAL